MTEDEMVEWHHRLDGHEFGWRPGRITRATDARRAAGEMAALSGHTADAGQLHSQDRNKNQAADWEEALGNLFSGSFKSTMGSRSA